MKTWAGVVMAAGLGKRMKSKLPKILHQVCGQAMLAYPVQALRGAGVGRIVLVVSPETEDAVRTLLGDTVEYVTQAEPLGTGHAVRQAASLLKGQAEHIMVLGGDTPLIQPHTLETLSRRHLTNESTLSLLVAPRAGEDLGRIVRDESGAITEIVEAAEPGAGDSGHESQINAGMYCFRAEWLWDSLPKIKKSSLQEFYLTSLVRMASTQSARVEALEMEDPTEAIGINNRLQLSRAEAALRRRVRERWLLEGVSMLDPDSTFVDATVELGQDTLILPNTHVLGQTRIGKDCTIGPNTVIRDSTIGDGCSVVASFVEEATVEESVDIGPFSHIRHGTHLERDVYIGNYAEIKNSRLGQAVKMHHLGYVGDATIGNSVNLGAGMITCNYDGVTKHRTIVEKGAFIGCDTMFVAPVKVGEGAVTGAGAVVINDVPAYRLAAGVPATIKESRKTGR